MRPKVVIDILSVALAAALLMWFARPERSLVPGPSPIAAPVSPATTARPVANDSARDHDRAAVLLVPPVQTDPAPPETHDEMVTRRVAELMDLAMSDDLASLNIILSELSNPDPAIRSAAVSATVQFDNSLAIPSLKSAYDRAEDPHEKIELEKAIDFLSTPAGPQIAEPTKKN